MLIELYHIFKLLFILFYFILFYFIFLLFRATPAAHGNSQARGQFGAIAAGLHHRNSNPGSKPRL